MKFIGHFLILTFLVSCYTATAQETLLPVSREATLIETTSPSEVMVRAKGEGTHDPRGLFRRPDPQVMNDRAEIDAMKSAIYYLLYNAETPILSTGEERAEFEYYLDDFFQADNLNKYITWRSSNYSSRVKLDETSVQIEMSFKINKRQIIDDLTAEGVLQPRSQLAAQVGLPFIMVLPQTTGDDSPLEKLNQPENRKAAEVIETYLTARQYDVLVPEQMQTINSMQQSLNFMSSAGDDMAYQIALSIGSDIYLTFSSEVENRKVGDNWVSKASVGIRAYETTTARLLGTATGYSEERPSAELVLVEEAVNNAVDQVLGRLTSYWKQDLDRGMQYKLVVTFDANIDAQTADDIAFGFGDVLNAITTNYRENVITNQTLDYIIWCNPRQFSRSSDVYRALSELFVTQGLPGELQRDTINRKLLLLTVKG
jgi:hypothetical protein